ncbi:MAG: tandem-95 repeat protein, partial [Myxococcaceae bacterium]|nr:tandem-95 repeat protein [Myxococcaceae bacterium]
RDFNGPDAFSVDVSDGTTSTPAAVSVSVNAISEPPRTRPTTIDTNEDGVLEAKLPATDPDGDPLTFRLLAQPRLGTLTLVDPATGAFRYVPRENVNGEDGFTFDVRDRVTTVTGQVTLRIVAVNDPPVATELTLSTDEDAPVEGTLVGSDLDGDPLSCSVTQPPAAGKAEIVDATRCLVRFTPARNSNGTETFGVSMSDGKASSAPARVTVSIASQNDPPVATSGSVTTDEDTAVTGTFKASDLDGDALRFQVARQPLHGTAVVVDPAKGTFVYTPARDYSGPDNFGFSAIDPAGGAGAGTILVEVRPVDDPPFGVTNFVTCPFRGSTTGRLQGVDREGKPVTFKIVELPDIGTVRLVDPRTGDFVFTTEGTGSGKVRFLFTVSDGTLTSPPTEQVVEVRQP